MSHPYRSQPARAFWSRAVSQGFEAHDVPNDTTSLFESGDRVMTAGSCFASNLIPWIEASDATYVRTEVLPPRLAAMPENLGYRTFSAAYGNIYTARHLRQLLQRAYGEFQPVEDRWYEGDHVIDPFRPGLRYPAVSDAEFDALTAQHLAGVRRAVESATVLVFTLGLTEAGSRPSTAASTPLPGHHPGHVRPGPPPVHQLHRLRGARRRRRRRRARATQQPVAPRDPHGVAGAARATATDQHVLVATTYSKSALRSPPARSPPRCQASATSRRTRSSPDLRRRITSTSPIAATSAPPVFVR